MKFYIERRITHLIGDELTREVVEELFREAREDVDGCNVEYLGFPKSQSAVTSRLQENE